MNRFLSISDFLKNQISGDWGKDKPDEKYSTEAYCIRGADINSVNEGNYNNLPIRYIDVKNKSKFLKEGNIVIEVSGGSPTQSTGRVSYVKGIYPNIICSNFCRAFEVKEQYSSKYFYYLIKNIYNSNIFFNFESKTTGIKNLLIDQAFKNIKIPLINLVEQQKIAKVISDLDAKIELNNKINTELEAMAKTLYDYWFVQFDFPNEEGKPYKTSGSKMVCNKKLKRDIPEGWEVDTLSSFINNDKSGDWGKEQEEGNYNQKVYCVRGADINGLNGKGELKTPERYILEKNLFKTLDPYDLIVEISGGSPVQSTGRLAYITEETLHRFDAPIICSNFCKAVTLKSKYYFYNFVFQWNSIYDAGVLFGYEGKTSGIKNLLFESFVSTHYTAIPPIELAEKFYDFMKPIQIKKEKNLKENQELVSLRDWLLPMLMNGQVTVGEVEEELGMVAETQVQYEIAEKTPEWYDQRFNLWITKQGLAARGEIDRTTLRELFDAMDNEDK